MSNVAPAISTLAKRIVEREAGDAHHDVTASATHIEHIFLRLQEVTASMVGEVGYQALVVRALALTRRRYPWLPLGSSTLSSATAFPDAVLGFPRTGWDVHFKTRDSEEARACATALLANVLGLVASFIGDDFTFRLVGRAWPDEDSRASGSGSGET